MIEHHCRSRDMAGGAHHAPACVRSRRLSPIGRWCCATGRCVGELPARRAVRRPPPELDDGGPGAERLYANTRRDSGRCGAGGGFAVVTDRFSTRVAPGAPGVRSSASPGWSDADDRSCWKPRRRPRGRGGHVASTERRSGNGSPRRSFKAGVGLVPEDRWAQGLLATIASSATSARSRHVRSCERTGAGTGAGRSEPVGATGPHANARHPGGNAVRWQRTEGPPRTVPRPRAAVLLLDEPTRGVDIGAKAEIYGIIDSWSLEAWGSPSPRPICSNCSGCAIASSCCTKASRPASWTARSIRGTDRAAERRRDALDRPRTRRPTRPAGDTVRHSRHAGAAGPGG